ncbi:MAG TPA: response regulator [Bryobacteraceae bacterium]|nr:response regulator [Bryobacteraceae bacterium]HPT25714.1 response regulator [Bryobacteraceae bacterium]
MRRHTEAAQSGFARVLLADDNPASRLTLQTVLETVGYCVDTAASAAEAVDLMDTSEYALVLSDLSMESPEAGLKVIEHAHMKAYNPATAIVTASEGDGAKQSGAKFLIRPENMPELLTKVASLIGNRASRRAARTMR